MATSSVEFMRHSSVQIRGGAPDYQNYLCSCNNVNLIKVSSAFQSLGYRVAILRDDDVPPDADGEKALADAGGLVVMWQPGRKLEEELFHSIPAGAVGNLLARVLAKKDESVVDNRLKSASTNAVTLDSVRAELEASAVSGNSRAALGKAAGGKNNPWFKTVSAMEEIGRNVVGPAFNDSDAEFQKSLETLFDWAENG